MSVSRKVEFIEFLQDVVANSAIGTRVAVTTTEVKIPQGHATYYSLPLGTRPDNLSNAWQDLQSWPNWFMENYDDDLVCVHNDDNRIIEWHLV